MSSEVGHLAYHIAGETLQVRYITCPLPSAVDGCVPTVSGGGRRVVEFLGIAVAVTFAVVLVAVNVHSLLGKSSHSHRATDSSPSTDSEGGGAGMSGAMNELDSWPMGLWKGDIVTPPPYTEIDPAPPAPSPPPYQLSSLPRIDV